MAGRIVREISAAITAAGATGITVASTTGFYERAYAYLAAGGQPGATIQITRIVSATVMQIRLITDPRGGGAGSTATPSGTSNYGTLNASAYAPGTITMPEQVVMNPNDQPLA